MAAGALSSLWGGDHVLGVGRDRQGGGRDPGVRLGGGCRSKAGGGGLPGGAGAAVAVAAAGAAGWGGGGLAGGVAGVVRGLAALPGGAGSSPADRARVRGSALGGRGFACVPGASGRVVGGGAAAPRVHGAAGAVRATAGLGGRDPKRDDDQPPAALGSGDGRARFSSDHHQSARQGAGARRAGAGRRQPTLRGGVRASARRPRPGCRRDRIAGESAGVDRRAPGHALPGAEESASGRCRAGEGVLGGRAGRDRRPRFRRDRAGAARARS